MILKCNSMWVLWLTVLCTLWVALSHDVQALPTSPWEENPELWDNADILEAIDSNLDPAEGSCIYENKSIAAGRRFKPEPCTYCHCPSHGGRAECAIQDCRHEPNCLKRKKQTRHDCCGICVQLGCIDSKGVTYEPGARIPSPDNCETCFCPKGGGRPICRTRHKRPCPAANCVNAVRQPGSCCHYCPAGDNCWLKDGDTEEILQAGDIRLVDGCKLCQCPDIPLPWHLRVQGPRAVCTIGDCSWTPSQPTTLNQ